MTTDLATLRQQFPALVNKTYLNYGGQGPLPQAAIDAIGEAYDRVQKDGPFSKKINLWISQLTTQLRSTMAAELGVDGDTITLTENVTAGCNIALWGLNWKKGDRILLNDCEHPGVVAAIEELKRRFEIEIDICPIVETLNHRDPTDAICDRIDSRTRLVVLSHVLWNTGQVLDLEKIVKVAHNSDALVLVDAAQSVGLLPLKLADLGVDFYGFTGHKWWCGPAGVGGLYVSETAREHLHPTYIGWRGIEMDENGNPTGWKPNGQRYEIATSAYPLYAGLLAAIEGHQKWGTATERYKKICQNSDRLWQQLSQIEGVTCLLNSPPPSGLVSFTIASQKHKELVGFLEDRGILTRTLLYPSCVRACVHYFSNDKDIDAVISGIGEFLSVDN